MAYPDQPYGFIPLRHKSGAPYNGAARPYWIDDGGTEAGFIGDPVILDGTANASRIEVPGMGSFNPGMLPGVIRATAGSASRVTGVIVSFGADTRDSEPHRVNSTERLVWIADDPDLVFSVQADGSFAIDDIGGNTDIVFTHSGSSSTRRSGAEVVAAGVSNSATKQTLVIGFVNDPLNTAAAVGNRVEVIFTLHTMQVGGGIVGI